MVNVTKGEKNMKYLAISKYSNGILDPQIFDTPEEMHNYLYDNYIPGFERVIFKMAFNEEEEYPDLLILSQNVLPQNISNQSITHHLA